MAHRTTLLLDDRSRRAAREIAHELDCSVSDAIRRAVVVYRDQLAGISPAARQRRRRTLTQLFELFADTDPAAEVRRLKNEDGGF